MFLCYIQQLSLWFCQVTRQFSKSVDVTNLENALSKKSGNSYVITYAWKIPAGNILSKIKLFGFTMTEFFLSLSPKHGEVSIHVEAYDYLVESLNFSIPVVLQKHFKQFFNLKKLIEIIDRKKLFPGKYWMDGHDVNMSLALLLLLNAF